jgi:1-acyl-sn-glycerol-3-phosphate acyltransferase
MLAALPLPIRLPLVLLLVGLNILFHALPLLAFAVVKALIPLRGVRRALSRVLVRFAEGWVSTNSRLLAVFTRTRWRIEGVEALQHEGWYLVLCNHQSWVDIIVLQHVLNRRVPFLKFFLKRELIWVPLLGLVWWALDFPFMRRYPRAVLERRPELRGKDLEATRKACARFSEIPVSVTNFVEGTRFSAAKHAEQGSPYAHLLRPRAGGVAFVLGAMGETLRSLLDVSIVYPDGRPTLIDLLASRVPEVRVHVRELPIPRDLTAGDYENDAAFRERFQAWINDLWREKDDRIARMRG